MSHSPRLLTRKMRAALTAALLGASAMTGATAAELTDDVSFEADRLEYDSKAEIATLSGSVVMRQNGYELRAKSVTYNRKTGEITATEGLTLKDPQGNLLGATAATLDDEMRTGLATNILLILSDGARVAAESAVRTEGRRTELDRALYSPCKVCDEQGNPVTPLWRVKAVDVVHDQEKRKISYNHVWIEFLGVPVIYTPWLSHPDPSLKRASGFLSPKFRTRKELGLTVALPYYWVLSDSADVTVTPTWNTAEGPLLGGEYRQAFSFGTIKLDGSVTYPKKRDDMNMKTDEHFWRGHIFADGNFRHDDHWQSTVRIEWAGDDTYLRRYLISKQDVLTNHYKLEGFYGRSYVSAEAMQFTGLRQFDRNGLNGNALPFLHGEFVTEPTSLGTFKVAADGLFLHRTDGLDSRRITLEGTWEKRTITDAGLVWRFAADVRGDAYHISDAENPDNPLYGGVNGSSTRFLSQGSVTLSWPLIRAGASTTQVLEPMVSAVLTPNGGNPAGIPNEDSRAFELADTNIFADNRFPGYDRWEPGPRTTYGMNWNVQTRKVTSDLLLAQSWRSNSKNDVFPDGTGLSGHFSDFVGRWHLQIGDMIDLYERFRLDKNNFAVRRNEVDLEFRLPQGSLSVGYMKLNRDLQEFDLEDREEIRVAGNLNLIGGWRLDGFVERNLDNGAHPLTHGLGLTFENECFLFSVDWRHDYFIDRDIVPGTAFGFQLKLKTLG